MKTRLTSTNTFIAKTVTSMIVIFSLSACATPPAIVPQLPASEASNSQSTVGADIAQANAFLNAGNVRDAAAGYFAASRNYPSPERERLILQAAELSSLFNDSALTQRYLAPLNFDQLSNENKSRFRLTQAQLAVNDRNYREALRILPQRVNDIPADLGAKILATRMDAAQSSGDKLALVQELVLQESTLQQEHQVKLNHDRIWGHAKQIPAFQLNEAKNSIGHPIVKNWLSLAQLSRVATNGPANKKQTFRSDLGRWIQSNNGHPGMPKALALLNAAPSTTVTPYNAGNPGQRSVITSTVQKPAARSIAPVKTPVAKAPVRPPVVKAPVKPASVARPAAVQKPVVRDPKIRSLYEEYKAKIK